MCIFWPFLVKYLVLKVQIEIPHPFLEHVNFRALQRHVVI